MRINLMDGSLQVLGGHPHDIDLQMVRAMVHAGHDVHVYCHIKADKVLLSHYLGLAPVTPLFSINPYASSVAFDQVAGDIIKNLEGGRVTANELRSTRPADIWLWPSFYPYQLMACAIARLPARVSACIHHPPDFFSAGDAGWWRYGFRQSHAAGLDLRVGFIEPETRYLYTALSVDGELEMFPFPNDGCENPGLRKEIRKIGIFGFQRVEKGSLLLRALVVRLIADGYQVVVHNSNNQKDSFEDVPGVICLGHVDDLDREIAMCDLVLAPYNPELYRYRGSGIVMSAIANGVPVVVPMGSAPGRLIEQNGAGTLFAHFSLPSILAAIQAAAANYPVIAAAAHGVALEWPRRHGVTRFVDAMIG